MKQLTLHIPDNQYAFFPELVQKPGFVKIEELDIPEEHKTIVRERMKNPAKARTGFWIVNRCRVVSGSISSLQNQSRTGSPG